MLPNFLIIGAEKSGTTWLYERLREHPDVYMTRTKEPHFFNEYNSNLEASTNWERGLEHYERLFDYYDGESAVGEATPMYLCDPRAPDRIRDTLEDVLLVCMLRDPIDRAYSHYWMARRKGHTDRTFGEIVRDREARFIERGRYGEQLERYLDRFSEDRLLVKVSEEVFANPREHLSDIFEVLGVAPDHYGSGNEFSSTENESYTLRSRWMHRTISSIATTMRRTRGLDRLLDIVKELGLAETIKSLNRSSSEYPEMSDAHREELSDYYEPTRQKVEDILGRTIDSWHS